MPPILTVMGWLTVDVRVASCLARPPDLTRQTRFRKETHVARLGGRGSGNNARARHNLVGMGDPRPRCCWISRTGRRRGRMVVAIEASRWRSLRRSAIPGFRITVTVTGPVPVNSGICALICVDHKRDRQIGRLRDPRAGHLHAHAAQLRRKHPVDKISRARRAGSPRSLKVSTRRC